MDRLDELIWTAHGDCWQAEGRLREPLGGGAIELPGIRLMASGLPHAQWNNGDVTDPALVDVAAVRAWYATRACGAGVPWGICVPTGLFFAKGQWLFRKRCMGLLRRNFGSVEIPPEIEITVGATSSDIDTFAGIDAQAFGGTVGQNRAWIEPHFGAPGFMVALAKLRSEPVGIATAVFTDARAGPCVGIFGVGVLERARQRGVGTALTSWLLERAFAAGSTLAHLNPDNDVAARLYARLGFSETAGFDVYGDL